MSTKGEYIAFGVGDGKLLCDRPLVDKVEVVLQVIWWDGCGELRIDFNVVDKNFWDGWIVKLVSDIIDEEVE